MKFEDLFSLYGRRFKCSDPGSSGRNAVESITSKAVTVGGCTPARAFECLVDAANDIQRDYNGMFCFPNSRVDRESLHINIPSYWTDEMIRALKGKTMANISDVGRQYEFTVSKPEDVDYGRIIDECGSPDAVIISSGVSWLVLLARSFTSKFDFADRVCVAGTNLDNDWGTNRPLARQDTPVSMSWERWGGPGLRVPIKLPDGYTAVNGWKHNQSLESLMKEIETAREYVRRIEIKVEVV